MSSWTLGVAQGVRYDRGMKALFAFCLTAVAACNNGTTPPAGTSSQPAAPPAAASQQSSLTRVTDPSQVCMVNDQFMGKPQIPVEVEGRTYFGCCPMCKERLEKQPGIRTATDPVTGEQIDKARAIIAQDPTGKVFYFATEESFKRYRG